MVGEDSVWNVVPDNSLGNASFEDTYPVDGNDWQHLPGPPWEGYPHQNSQTVVFTGETMFNSDETFEAWDGDGSLKLWGLYEGDNTENNIFQTWFDSSLPPGTEFFVDAALMSDDADWIGQGGNSVVLFAKYFSEAGDGSAWIHQNRLVVRPQTLMNGTTGTFIVLYRKVPQSSRLVLCLFSLQVMITDLCIWMISGCIVH